jgi:hypothetical protein
VVPHLNVFTKDVVTYLPYRLSTRPVDEDFYAYMIDEERLIGLKVIRLSFVSSWKGAKVIQSDEQHGFT